MTQEQKDFETKYHFKVVKPLNRHYKDLPNKEYIVTASLLNWEDNGKTTIFAIKAIDYNLENKHWITIKISADEFDKCISDFEIIRDGYEEYVKPVILDEALISWEKEEDGYYFARYSSYFFEEKCGCFKSLKTDIKRKIQIGDEYMFIYKSIYDLDKPNCYIISIPKFESRQQIEEYIKPFRRDVLNNKVVNGMNRRLLEKEV